MRLRPFACLGFATIAFTSVLAVLAACSDDDKAAAPANSDSGADTSVATVTDSGNSTVADTGVDSGPPVIRCSDAELAAADFTDAGDGDGGSGLVISFPTGAEPQQYTNHCATVKAGTTITFTGSFMNHPLEAAGGDTPNPIPTAETNQPDDQVVVLLPDAGTFGYQCEFHPEMMFGAVRVVP